MREETLKKLRDVFNKKPIGAKLTIIGMMREMGVSTQPTIGKFFERELVPRKCVKIEHDFYTGKIEKITKLKDFTE